MTDAERQHLREHFLEPETRCDFFVDENRKKLWKCLLDMLVILDRTCKEHGLRYFLFYGSLLGAVRHKGFVPWDDDLDIVMPRPDFDRIQKILEKELEPPYFLQNFKTDPGYVPPFFKIRNSSTAGITPWFVEKHIAANLGIFIDVHSLDGMPETDRASRCVDKLRQFVKIAMHRKSGWDMIIVGNKKRKFGNFLAATLSRSALFSLAAWLPRRFSYGKTKRCAVTPMFYSYRPPRHCYPTEWFSETETADFEYLRVPVPKMHDEILSSEYGNWHKFVRGTEGGAAHAWMRYDTERDFKTVLAEDFGFSQEELGGIPTRNGKRPG